MREGSFDAIGFMKKEGYVVPIEDGWRLSSDHRMTTIIDALSIASGHTVTANEIGRLLQSHHIY